MKTITSQGSRTWLIHPHPLYRPEHLKINWLTLLPKKADESAHERAYLRESTKGFLAASLERTERSTGILSPGTVRLRFLRLRVLCRWMAENKIWRFSILTPSDLVAFLRGRLAVTRSPGDGPDAATNTSIRQYCDILEDLWILRDSYVAPLRFDVRAIAEIVQILARATPVKIWSPVELPIAKRLLLWAMHEVEQSQNIENAIAEIWSTRKHWVGLSRSSCKSQGRKLLVQLDPSGPPIADAARRTAVQRGIRNLVGAILLLVLFFTGMRISEVLTLRTDCLVQRRHADGMLYSYLKGPGAKRKGRERLWVVPDIIVQAIRLQIRLFGTMRELHDVTMLFLARCDTMRVLTGRFKPTRLLNANRLVRDVIAHSSVETGDLVSTFHAHRARKTFARFVVMRDKSALESLAHHYGHLYTATLDRHYVGNDFRLEELVREEDVQELRLGLTSLLTSATIGGKGAERIAAVRDQVSTSSQFRGKLVLDSIVEKLVQNGMVLAPCDWGYCLYARDQSMCKGNASGPNPVLRAPTTCASCSNFAVVDRHLPWWEKRHSEQTTFLKSQNLPDQTRRVVSEQLAMTEKVLTRLIKRRSMKEDDEQR